MTDTTSPIHPVRTIRYARLPEIHVPDKPLGRHIAHDQRSHDYPAATVDASQLASVNHSAVGLPLNQGQIGSCTGNALVGSLNSAPNNAKLKNGPFTEHGAITVYTRETKLEGQPYPQHDPGGSGLMVCKAAKQLGWISGYQHAFGIQQALLALVVQPVITGVSWLSSFDTPDSNGLVTITTDAYVRGGHEIVADEIVVPDGATISDLDQILVWFWNSWGLSYGVGGRFCMTAATWAELLAEQGDVTVPTV